jgi:hypothetical protein
MCWLNPEPLQNECIICRSIEEFESHSIHKPVLQLDEVYDEDYCQDAMLPECTRCVYVDLLKNEANLGCKRRAAKARLDAHDSTEEDVVDAIPISQKTGRRIISNMIARDAKRRRNNDYFEDDSDYDDDSDSDADSMDVTTPHGVAEQAEEPFQSAVRTKKAKEYQFVDGEDDDDDSDDDDAASECTTSSQQPPMSARARGKRPAISKRRVLTNTEEEFDEKNDFSVQKTLFDDEFPPVSVQSATSDDDASSAGPAKMYTGAPVFAGRDVTNDPFMPKSESLNPKLTRAEALAEVPLGVRRLLRFIDVLDIFTAPWAPIQFEENEQMLKQLIATHLKLIVGKKEWKEHKSRLLAILDTDVELARKQNVVWITNRQQGKTSTLAKFLAVLAYLSPEGGSLVYVYSTSRDRAQELIDASRKYLWWATSTPEIVDALADYGLEPPKFKSDNASGFKLQSATNSVAVNLIKARPKSVESCRGDAPHSAFFDEVAFVTEDFWCVFIPTPLAKLNLGTITVP